MKWYEKSYRRNLVDMHIEDWNDEFLSKLDAEKYVSLLTKANVQTAMVYANSHVGYCYWPTPYGKTHRNLKSKDFLGDFIRTAHKAEMDVVVYFSLIYDNWAHDQNEEWRMKKAQSSQPSRYRFCCPNSTGYREYVKNQLQDIVQRYSFEGFFLDMTFWPDICLCENCQKRYMAEKNRGIPETINWDSNEWLEFQKSREDWLTEFAHFATDCIQSANPELTVEHQASSITAPWTRGVDGEFINASDYAGGDLYGGLLEQTFICKLYNSVTKNHPFEYMTSRCDPDLTFHTGTKSKEELALHNYITIAHNGAFLFIDAIHPNGEIETESFEIMSGIFRDSSRYETYLKGTLLADAAIFFSFHSKFDATDSGFKFDSIFENDRYAHLASAIRVAEALSANNILYNVISGKNLAMLNETKVLIIPDAIFINDEDAEKICSFVKNGGSLYVSGIPQNKLLQKLLGIKPIGKTAEKFTYIKANKNMEKLLPEFKNASPLSVNIAQPLVKAENDEDIAATLTLPYTNPNDANHFASIHSNPPGIDTIYPSMVTRKVEAGNVVWCAAPIERIGGYTNKTIFLGIITKLCKEYTLTSTAPASVEFLLFKESDQKYSLRLVNVVERYPASSVNNFHVSIKMADKSPKTLTDANTGKLIPFEYSDGRIHFSVEKLDLFMMILIDC